MDLVLMCAVRELFVCFLMAWVGVGSCVGGIYGMVSMSENE